MAIGFPAQYSDRYSVGSDKTSPDMRDSVREALNKLRWVVIQDDDDCIIANPSFIKTSFLWKYHIHINFSSKSNLSLLRILSTEGELIVLCPK